MNENTSADSPDEPVHQPLHLLREAREARGVHMAVLSVALKVSVKKFEALEAGRYDELPGLTFARALAASACRHLKIDPAPILAQIPQAESPRLGYAESSMDAPFQTPSETGTRARNWLSRSAVLGALALLAGALLLVYWPEAKLAEITGKIEAEAPVAQAPAPAPVIEAAPPAVSSEVVPAGEAAVLMTSGLATAATVPPAVPPVTVSVLPVTGAAAVPAVAAPAAVAMKTVSTAGSLMSIKATSDSWVEVTNAGGSVLLRRLLKMGEVVDFASAPPYNVLLGRADAAEITVRGQRFDTTPFARNSVARFEVK